MLLQLFSHLVKTTPTQERASRDNLRTLITHVHEELERAETLFNLAEDDALLETAIYQLKSLTAYQEFLLRAIRENELEPEAFLSEAAAAPPATTAPPASATAPAPSC